jgi:ribosomal protein S27AE
LRLKTVFTFTARYARIIRKSAEYVAQQQHTPVDTQAYLNQLILRAWQEIEDEQQAARKIRTCPLCGKVFSGNPACPTCGHWVA